MGGFVEEEVEDDKIEEEISSSGGLISEGKDINDIVVDCCVEDDQDVDIEGLASEDSRPVDLVGGNTSRGPKAKRQGRVAVVVRKWRAAGVKGVLEGMDVQELRGFWNAWIYRSGGGSGMAGSTSPSQRRGRGATDGGAQRQQREEKSDGITDLGDLLWLRLREETLATGRRRMTLVLCVMEESAGERSLVVDG
ncbi:hypothetical protein BHM03_00016905 [Ensete ventricosum]|nr:hypothetical protein BHM03_00016905 [Ensete ventricosum]